MRVIEFLVKPAAQTYRRFTQDKDSQALVMPINFHTQKNRYTYTGREADRSWREAMTTIVDPVGKHIADIGCGGGIYTRAWSEMGASQVTGIDFSEQMVQAVSESTFAIPNITVLQGSATATGLGNESVDIVFERALIHHLTELATPFQEAKRILRKNGMYIIQDRTLEDVQIPGSPGHLRGYFFECFPQLLETEKQRRPSRQTVAMELQKVGFAPIKVHTLWETRQVYAGQKDLSDDLRARTGRSILHELTDPELDRLISYILPKLPANPPIVERDRWTVWHALKSC
jgi:ubiquinone/menaquinone biosynthesis C-methylase UbiE